MAESHRPRPAVAEFMTPSPQTIRFDQSLAEAARLMAEHAIRHLPVVRDGELVGVLSDRDLAIVASLGRVPPERIAAAEAMTPTPYCVPAEMPLVRVVKSMAQNKYGCAIVTEGESEKVLGMFTVTDALGALARLLSADDKR